MFDYYYLTLKIPFRFKRKFIRHRFKGYKVVYKKSNGQFITQFRSNLPRITEFPDYVRLRVDEYVGLSNGFGWVITDVEIL